MHQEASLSYLGNLPLRAKREKYQYKKLLSVSQMKGSLQEMVQSGMRNACIIDMVKTNLMNAKIQELKVRPRRVRSEPEEHIVNEIQDKNFNFFIEKMETSNFKRGIDKVLNKFNKKYTIQTQPSYHHEPLTTPHSPTKTNSLSKASISLSRRKQSVNFSTTIHRDRIQLNKVVMDANYKRKRSNTFLFHLPTKKAPRRSPNINYDFSRDWEEQLLININFIQGSFIKNKKNIKVEKQRLSMYLRQLFSNEIITHYYKFQQSQSFIFLKGIIQELIRLTDKELRLISFFTYDVNQDGFICEEDIYHFVSKLPQNSKIIQDLNHIIEFLRRNKIRSSQTNIPDKLLKGRQKAFFSTLTNASSPQSKNDNSKKKESFTKKLFTVSNNTQKQISYGEVSSNNRRFQINFDVFSLIFAQKLPILVPEVICSLIRPINMSAELVYGYQDGSASRVEMAQKEWGYRMSRTKQLLQRYRDENDKLSLKIQ